MSLKQKLKDEIASIGLSAVFFAVWIAALMLLKSLILAEYRVEFHEWSMVVIGALVLSKVVVVLQHVSLGAWVQSRPAWVAVVLRTAIYSAGVAVVIVIEKGLEGRHEHGGFLPALRALLHQTDAHHVWANTLCLSGALLVYNVLFVVQRHLGRGGLMRIFLVPLPEEGKAVQPQTK